MNETIPMIRNDGETKAFRQFTRRQNERFYVGLWIMKMY